VTRGILFDLYGTLVSGLNQDARDATSRLIAAELGVDPEGFVAAIRTSWPERFVGALGDVTETLHALASRLGGSPSVAALKRSVEHRMDLTHRQLRPGSGVLDALDGLRSAGWRLALVTNCSAETPAMWPDTELAERFDVAVFSSELGVRKPDPEIYRAALRALEVPVERCAFVGDGAAGELPGAEAVGLAAIRVTGLANPAEHDGEWIGPQVDSLAELAPVLDALVVPGDSGFAAPRTTSA
jgi:putative hydrolase of the HAD superfamily